MFGMIFALAFAGQVNTDVPVLAHVELVRSPIGVCSGNALYVSRSKDAAVVGDLGERIISIDVEVPCARLDALDALLPLPSDRGGKLLVRTDGVIVRTLPNATCAADLSRVLTPIDAETLDVYGGGVIRAQRVDPIACTRLGQLVVGALITNARKWPTARYALPFAMKP